MSFLFLRVTAAYLACKVEEFYVTIDQYIGNIKGDKERAMDVVLNSELVLMKEIDFHLTVHNAFRPVEGILIDLKVNTSLDISIHEIIYCALNIASGVISLYC